MKKLFLTVIFMGISSMVAAQDKETIECNISSISEEYQEVHLENCSNMSGFSDLDFGRGGAWALHLSVLDAGGDNQETQGFTATVGEDLEHNAKDGFYIAFNYKFAGLKHHRMESGKEVTDSSYTFEGQPEIGYGNNHFNTAIYVSLGGGYMHSSGEILRKIYGVDWLTLNASAGARVRLSFFNVFIERRANYNTGEEYTFTGAGISLPLNQLE